MHQILIDEIEMPYLDQTRPIRIYLPPNYNTSDKYPVIYMHDAQNLYDIEKSSYGAIWDVHDHMDTIYNTHNKAFIVVGIDNYEGRHNRLDEYSPWVNTSLKDNPNYEDIQTDVGGLGGHYVDFLVEKLIPYINKNFSVQEGNYGLIGSSMGGFISLYAGFKYPHIFTQIGAFSTAVWFEEESLLNFMKTHKVQTTSRWYLDVGTKETSNREFDKIYLSGTHHLHDLLEEKVTKDQIKLVIDEGGIHNERDWSRRFVNAIEFLYDLK